MTRSDLLTLDHPGGLDAVATDAERVDLLRHAPKSMAEQHWPSAWAEIERQLLASRSAKVRNAAALALADMRYPRTGEAINSLLVRPDVALTAGTLIFALEEADASISLEATVNIVRRGSYESRAELVILLGKTGVSPFDQEHGRSAERELSRLAAGDDADAAEAASLVLDLLDLGE